MNLLLTWPEQQHAFYLSENYCAEKPLCFDVNSGEFISDKVSANRETLHFYWNVSGPVMVNHCEEYVCIVNKHPLAYQKRIPLQSGMMIQAGLFMLLTNASEASDLSAELFNDPLINPLKHERMGKVEEILPQGGYHLITMESSVIEKIGEINEEAILKNLEFEYKKYLILDEQRRENYTEAEQSYIVSGVDPLFEQIREGQKEKTITECIFETSALIEKVLAELDDNFDSEDFQPEEEQYDLLKILAPESILPGNKKRVSNLVYHDLYQPGLDSKI